jgi:hypothetical protein
MKRLKEALVSSYIASIALGIVLAQGLLSLAAIFLEPVNRLTVKVSSRALDQDLISNSEIEIFDLPSLIVQLARAALFIGVSLLLARWLYPSHMAPAATPEPETLEQ